MERWSIPSTFMPVPGKTPFANGARTVVTVLHEKSKGLEAYDKYDRDLQNHNEVKQIFDEIRRNDEQAVQRLQECLGQLVGQGSQQNRAA